MKKTIIFSSALVFVGIIVGSVAVYGFYGLSQESEPKEEIKISKNSDSTTCKVNLSKEELDMKAASAYLKFRDIKSSFTPSGVPEIYGKELNISFDEVQDAIDKVKIFGPTYGSRKIILTGIDLDRYIDIGFKIACEFCCNVKTLVDENGDAACGCAHSQMMRGLTAYLIKNHPEMSNEQILGELEKWKVTYFPKQTLSEELKRLEESGDSGIEDVLREFPDFLPQMVGGC